jgi:hypothetical protein
MPSLELDDTGYASVRLEELENLLADYLSSVEVDEAWYLAQYADVRKAHNEGTLRMTPSEHYRRHGYLEGRLPFAPEVDEEAYRARYPDVEKGISQGAVPSALHHFITHGYKESREPQPKLEGVPSTAREPAPSAQRNGTMFRRTAL